MIIKDYYIDMAGNYRYLVEVDDTLDIPLKYKTYTSATIVLQDAQNIYDKMVENIELNMLQSINFDL